VPEGECEIQCWDAVGTPVPCDDPCVPENDPEAVYWEIDWSDPRINGDGVTWCYPTYFVYADGSREYDGEYCTPLDYSDLGGPVTTLPATGTGR
jgi:hypothetical protein